MLRAAIAVATLFLISCGGQRGLPKVEARSQPAPAASPQPAPQSQPPLDLHPAFFIPAGTSVRVRLDQALNTKYLRPGSGFTATLDAPIVDGNHVVIPSGTPVEGAVVASKTSGRFRGRAYLELTLHSFTLNGVRYRIATATDTRASANHKRRNLVLIAGGTATGASIGAIAAGGPGALIGAGAGAAAGVTTEFITGRKNVRIPAETEMVFRLRAPLQVSGV